MNRPHVHVQIGERFTRQISSTRVRVLIGHTLDQCHIQAGTLTIVVSDDETVQALNFQYTGSDTPTDVLSFPGRDTDQDFVAAGQSEPYWGDVIIAYPTAARQAADCGHQPVEEVLLLALHGTLHLLGFDHQTAEGRAKMWAQQAAILADHGLAHVQPTEGAQ
jgi:probable rRNA maturation factor